MTTAEFKSDVQVASEITDARRAFYFLSNPAVNGNKVSGFEVNYGGVGETILVNVAENAGGFQADIAKKALDGMRISDKQAWCVAFAFLKLDKSALV